MLTVACASADHITHTEEIYEQSTNPFQADIEALRAVSTVPPITTNFWESSVSMVEVGNEILHTNVSWIELVLRPSGANQPLTVSMFMSSVTGRVNGGKKIYTLRTGQGVLFMPKRPCEAPNLRTAGHVAGTWCEKWLVYHLSIIIPFKCHARSGGDHDVLELTGWPSNNTQIIHGSLKYEIRQMSCVG
jgi:hypothetical protein